MLTKVVTSLSLVLSSVSAVALNPVAAQAQVQAPVPFVQCVKNVFGTGIVAKVRWYDPVKVELIPGESSDNPDTPADEKIGQLRPIGNQRLAPVREESIAVGQQSCFSGLTSQKQPHLALITVVGAEYLNEAITLAAGTVVSVGGAVVCFYTGGAACPAVAAGVSGVVSAVGMALPDGKAVFYAGTPGTLEVKGTAWTPVAIDKTLGVAQLVHQARIDFCNTKLRDTTTADNVTVDFMSKGVSVGTRVLSGVSGSCAPLMRGYVETAFTTDKLIDAVRLTTSGGDALFIDQLLLYRDGQAIVWDGRDEGGGWCLSTDENDYKGGWEGAALTCSKVYTFASPAT